jgi:hypothetical protein
VAALIRDGFWIPLIFIGSAVLYSLWVIYRNLDRLRHRGNGVEEGLGDVLLQYRVALERIHRAEAWIEAGELDKAVQELKEVQAAHGGVLTAQYVLGKAYLAKGELSLAKECLEGFLDKTRPYDGTSKERVREVRELLKELV